MDDTLSIILFNYVLDIAFYVWRLSLRYEGIFLAHGVPRLTNIRYADDVLLYAKSVQELESMTERLLEALKAIGLLLNATKTKMIRCNTSEDDSSLNFVEIDCEFVKVLSDADFHRYLGKLQEKYIFSISYIC